MSSEKKMTGEEFIEESGNQTGPAVEAAPAAEEIRQGGIVTVMVMGIDSNPDRYTIEAPMPLREFLKEFKIPLNKGWKVFRDGSVVANKTMINPGDVLNIGKLSKNG